MAHSLGAFVLRERIGFTEEVFALRGAEIAEIVQGARAELEPQDSESIRIQINIQPISQGSDPCLQPPQKALPCFHNNKDPATSTQSKIYRKTPKMDSSRSMKQRRRRDAFARWLIALSQAAKQRAGPKLSCNAPKREHDGNSPLHGNESLKHTPKSHVNGHIPSGSQDQPAIFGQLLACFGCPSSVGQKAVSCAESLRKVPALPRLQQAVKLKDSFCPMRDEVKNL